MFGTDIPVLGAVSYLDDVNLVLAIAFAGILAVRRFRIV